MAHNLTGPLSAKGNSITDLPAPTDPGDAARKSYVDAFVQEIQVDITESAPRYLRFTRACVLSNLRISHGGTGPTLAWATSPTDANGVATTWTAQTFTPVTGTLTIAAGTVLRLNVTAFTVYAAVTFDRVNS